jgi:hypothetical protein
MNYLKKIDDISFKKYYGRNINESWYTTIINSNKDGFYIDASGNKQILFIFKKSVINAELQKIAINTFLQESKKKHSNRGMAGGILPGNTTSRVITKTGQNEGNYIASNISGYYDRALREHRGLFKSQIVCRTTAFTLNNKDLWLSGLPFIQHCSKLYKKFGKKYYNLQKKEWDTISPLLKIPKTVFTTITSNYNWRTSCHTDSGDSGLGNLIVVGHGFTGCYLGLPQFKILIKVEPGDFLLMDTHQYHCNTELNITDPSGFRLSFVMYIRSDISKCKHKSIVGKTHYITYLKNEQ